MAVWLDYSEAVDMSSVRDLDWISRIISDKEPESVTLDFKRELPGGQAGERKAFLSDVVAMANTHGGQIIYGISDVDSFADEIVPISNVTKEDARQRLMEMIQRGVEPTLRGVSFEAVDVDGGFVLVLTVDQQFAAGPFRTNFDGSQRFTYREGTQNFPMPYPLIRNAFGARASALGALSTWRAQRSELLVRQIEQKVMKKGPWLVLHVLPVSSFSDQLAVSPKEFYRQAYTFNSNSASSLYNLDGIRFFNGLTDADSSKYVQFFRNGTAEAGREVWRAVAEEQSDKRVIGLTALARDVREMVTGVVTALSAVGVVGEAHFCLGIHNAEGWRTSHDDGSGFSSYLPNPIPSKAVLLPPIEADLPLDASSFDALTRSILDIAWQMAGNSGCPHFGGDGRWHEPRSHY
ncbi:ATP-binding protein [Lysobacter arenosi]|uniref:ATP-binding protein n=1 Tax=Lysobacter arenosi TaxID=2795387 RepID=A0ABX7RDU1_9GAMM|nr:ATP-binding protein [Lysobacter arenosi]QSX75601.1 ATP-binding protein [Lysobacter arenosi]